MMPDGAVDWRHHHTQSQESKLLQQFLCIQQQQLNTAVKIILLIETKIFSGLKTSLMLTKSKPAYATFSSNV